MLNKIEKGFNSICADGKHILLWDFDLQFKDFDLVYHELLDIQRQFNLSTIYILKSRHGFNAICLDKFDLVDAYVIKRFTQYSDINHNTIGFKRGGWVLRFGNDKSLLMVLGGNGNKYNKSYAHKKLLNYGYSIVVNDNKNFDNLKKIKLECYKRKKKK